MSYFLSAQAEYRAKRIAQMLAPHTNLSATRDGSVIANFDGHMYQFGLENGKLAVIGKADLKPAPIPDFIIQTT